MEKIHNYQTLSKKLFIVDDDVFYLSLLNQYFINQHLFEIKVFSNTSDFLKNLDDNPDYVLLDYHLSENNSTEITGLEILKKIKSNNPKTIVIILSAQKKSDVVLSLIEEGADNYIIKDSNTFNSLDEIFDELITK
jgi:two-component system, NtrC family, response regulator AtoC